MEEREKSLPLVAFTVLGPASVGSMLGTVIFSTATQDWALSLASATAALVFAGLAVLMSLAHLNKPMKAYRALRRFPRSPLSRENGFYSLYLLLTGIYWLLIIFGYNLIPLGALAFVVGIVAVIATAQVYLVPARPSWYHWSTMLAFLCCLLSLGLSTTLSVALGWPEAIARVAGVAFDARVLIILGIVGTAFALWHRVAYLKEASPDTRTAWQLVRSDYQGLWWLRLIVGLLVPLVAVLASFAFAPLVLLAWVALLVGELIDRSLFFVSSVPLSFQGELARARLQTTVYGTSTGTPAPAVSRQGS